MSDEAARSAALAVDRSFIVQAPAGSGKTELLIQRYLKLLAVVDHPEEVLAITFTKKAAAEMRQRVIAALQASERQELPSAAHQLVTAEAAAAVLRRDAEQDWNLIANSSRLRIQTLDALNAAIARMQPVSSGSGAAYNAIAVDAQMKALYQQAAFLTLDLLAEQHELRNAIQEVLAHLDNNTGLYGDYVARMLATRDQWLPFIGSGQLDSAVAQQLRDRLEDSLRAIVVADLEALQHAVPETLGCSIPAFADYAAANLEGSGNTNSPICRLRGMVELPGTTEHDAESWQAIAALLLTDKGDWRKTVDKRQGFPAENKAKKQSFVDLLNELREHEPFRSGMHGARKLPPQRYSDEQWSVLLALFKVLPLAVTELKRLFSERGVTDYIEVALSAASALGTADDPGDVALLLDYRLRHLLVDEMQDTANAQYAMLQALSGGWQDGDGRTLFCVGDPMQSIYRFRNAEVGQFLLARRSGIGDVSLESLTLRQNFRSGENLVTWFNQVFPGVLAASDDVAKSAVAYEPSVAVPAHAGKGECVSHALFGADDENEALRGCDLISDILAGNPEDNLAVLVRSRSQLSKLLAQLRRSGIEYQAIEIDRLTDLPEVIDALALTRAIAHHGDRLAWLALLRSPWVGLDWADLLAIVRLAPARTTVLELLQDETRLEGLSEYGQAAVRHLLDTLQPGLQANRVQGLRERIESLWLALGGPGILSDEVQLNNVYRYFDVLEDLEQAGTLADVARLEASLDLERVSSDGQARVQVMTMHKAKGLQFDHVLLFGLGRKTRASETRVLNWLDLPAADGTVERIVSPIGPRGELEKDPLHQYIQGAEANKDRYELGRLLYVACTRARKSLHLMGHVSLNEDGSDFKAPPENTLLHLLWPVLEADFRSAFVPAEEPTNKNEESGWILPELRRFDTHWRLPDVDRLFTANSQELPPENDSQVEFYWVGSGARIAGTIVHRWLQVLAQGGLPASHEVLPKLRQASLQYLRRSGIQGELANEVADRVELALHRTLDDEKGRWLVSGPGDVELALSGIVEGEVASVILDRVRVDDQGVHWIVDYKTSSHEGGDLAAFLRAEVERYSPQLARYQQIYKNFCDADTRCALYFPLLQKFVPLDL